MARRRRQGCGSADNRSFFTRLTEPTISALRRITARSSNFRIADSRLRVAFSLAAAVVLSLLALPSTAEAQRPRLNLRAGPHSQHASTEHGSPTFRFQVAASGNRQELGRFCGDASTAIAGRPCAGSQNSDNAVKIEFDVEWQSFDDYGLQRYSGYPVHTKTALVSQGAVNNSNMTVGESPWVWDRTVNGIPRDDQRPLRATVTMTVIDTSKARAGSTTTHQLVLNPTIAILTQGISATEGTDTHMEFPVAMTPPPLEPVTVDYTTKDYSATAGSDYTATSGTLTFAAGETAKTIRVPITNDAISDSGELLGMVFSNPTGAARMITLGGEGESQSVVEALGQIFNDEPGAEDLPVVTIASESGSIAEGSDAVFTLTRTGETDDALTVTLAVTETGAMLSDSPPSSATFATGEAETELRVATVGDDADEDDSTLTVTLTSGETYRLGTNDQMASSVTVLDDDAASLPGGTVAVAGTTIWAADMTVTDYGNSSIGAGTADLLANQRGSEGLQARHLYYHTGERKLRMAFTSSLATGPLTLAAGNVYLAFPEGRSGDSSFTWDDVAVDWTDGQTFEARLVSGAKEAVEAPDPRLKALTVSEATLSPAFDADTVAYTAMVAAATERVTLSGTLNDDDASLAYTPSTDADSSTAGHQVDVAVGETTATITVTADDGETTRAYRVVVKRPAPEVVETSTPTVGIAGGSGTEGADTSIGFTVTLDEAATDTVTVDYATSDGTATAGTDYTSTSGTLTFDAGTTSKTISVSMADDETDESDETFTVTLSNASGADLGTSTATGTITNRAVVVETTPTVSIAGGSGTEGDDASISFTVTLDAAASATVTVDYATSDGSAESGDDYTATSGTLSFSAGETSKTISVAIEDDIENESDETFTVTLSNASGADLGTSSATGTIRNRYVAPLTATFSNVPAEHTGSEFTFDLAFSENVEAGYARVRDDALRATGATIERAQRKTQGSNQNWTIAVKPLGTDAISITLPATADCDATGAICTYDGRKLSHSSSASVLGPVGISIADVEVVEAAGAVLAFTVALTRPASSQLTVDYATSDGTATAGVDYTAASGTLTIGAGSSSGTIQVSVLDDEHNEGSETFTVTLSNASSGQITDATATGTITNHDALPAALTARFGRGVATHVLDALEGRLETASGSYVRLGGHQLGGGPDVREAIERLAPDRSLWDEAAANASRDMTVRDLLLGSAFHLVSNPDEAATGPQLSAWGRVATSGFDGQQDRLSLNGTVTTATLGVDGVWEHWLTGVALAYSEGDGSFTQVELPGGDVASSLTSVHPYVAYALSDRVRLWGMVGYGSGSLQLRLAEQRAMDTDLAMTMGALGIRGSLLEPSQPEGGLALALRSDVLWLRMDSAAVAGMAATEADVSRLRLVLEGSRPVVLATGGLLIPTLEVGLRHDGGDAETGSGVEVGGRLRYTSAWGLSVEASVRGLLAHEASDYQEWGASGALRFDAGQQGLGLTASIVPTWGSAASGVDRLWGQPQASGLTVGHPLATAAAGRLDAELGYGVAALRGRGLLTPYVRAALAEGSEQAWHVGARLGLPASLNFSVEASRRARDGDAAAHELALLATLGW